MPTVHIDQGVLIQAVYDGKARPAQVGLAAYYPGAVIAAKLLFCAECGSVATQCRCLRCHPQHRSHTHEPARSRAGDGRRAPSPVPCPRPSLPAQKPSHDPAQLQGGPAGLRACEIAGLDWAMVLKPSGQLDRHIAVARTIAKNGNARRVPINPELGKALARLHGASQRPRSGPVIRSERDAHLRPRSVVNWFAGTLRRHGAAGLLVAFGPAHFHHPFGQVVGLHRRQLARYPGAGWPPRPVDHPALHRGRPRRAAQARSPRLIAFPQG